MSARLPKTPPWVATLFEEVSATLPGERRKMFGSLCTFIGGNLASGTWGQSFFVRLSEGDRETLLALDGAEPFAPMPGRPMSNYVVLPRTMLDDDKELRAWLRRSADYAGTLPEKQKKKPAAKKKKR